MLKAVEEATAPFQHALKTRAGTECVSHILQTLTDLDARTTILSVDGVGSFDLISRNSTMEGLLHMEGGDQLLPHVRMFYSSPSTFLWEDEVGTVHPIHQGEGGEQGDPLMPLLFALGQHSSLVAISNRLQLGERLCAFLDDLYVISTPDRTVHCHRVMEEELWRHARIRLHHGKTAIWNRGGEVPVNIWILEAAARRDPTATVWRGDAQSVLENRGITIWGTPVGTPEFVARQLEKKVSEHQELLNKIPDIKNLQCAWLVLLYCATARANYFLRTVGPERSHTFAIQHDAQVWRCFCQSTGFAGDPSREGPHCIGAQVEFDDGVHSDALLCFVSPGPGPCWHRWTHAYCSRGDAGPPP